MELAASWPSKMDLRDVGPWAQRVEALGFDVMHVPETVHDPFVVAAIAAAATQRLVIRTSMVVAFPRSPMVTAISAWDLAGLSGGRFQLGLASQVRGNIVGRFSTEWSEPVARLEDYLGSVRAIFHAFESGEPLDYVGSHYRFDRLQPYFNPGPVAGPAPLLWSGGVNARMCEMAGRSADGFVCHPTNSHPQILRSQILPALAAGARAAGRVDGGPAVVAGPQPLMAPTAAGLADVFESRRAELAFLYSTPAYRTQLEEFGLGDVGEALTAMAASDEWAGLGEHLSDDVMRALVPSGTYADMPEVLSSWYGGLCHGLVLGVPEEEDDDEAISAMVQQCKQIPSAPSRLGRWN